MDGDRALTIATALAIVMIVLIVLRQAIGQFDIVLKTVLRTQEDESDSEPVSLRPAPAVVVAAIVALSLLIAFLTW